MQYQLGDQTEPTAPQPQIVTLRFRIPTPQDESERVTARYQPANYSYRVHCGRQANAGGKWFAVGTRISNVTGVSV